MVGTFIVGEVAGAEMHIEEHQDVLLLVGDVVRHEDPVITVWSKYLETNILTSNINFLLNNVQNLLLQTTFPVFDWRCFCL